MTDQTAPDTEPTNLPMALTELRHARAEIARLTPFVAVADGASRAAEHWESETKRWLAFIGRGMDTHTRFSVLKPDGTTEELPCADWCYACRLERTEGERDGAYRERAHLLAWLATLHAPNAVLAPAVDIDDDDGWHLLFLTVAGRQMSWHIAPRDMDLLTHVERVDVADPRVQWDGHTTEEKYQRIRTLPWGEMRDAVRTPGATEAETTTRVFAALHRSAEQGVTRVIDLYERWVKAGPPPLGTSVSRWWDARLVELHAALDEPAQEQS